MEIGSPLYRSEDVRAIDCAALAGDGLSGHELMERAGRAAFELLRARWPGARRIAVHCGGGNNGGDGYVVARLAREAGLEVSLSALAAPAPERADACRVRRAWEAAGGSVSRFSAGILPAADVVVDALLGIGLKRAPSGEAAAAIAAVDGCDAPRLALDVPSGLDADTGATPGVALRADCTLTFVADKPGLHTGRGRALCGEVVLAELGIGAATRAARMPAAWLLRAGDLHRWLPRRARDAHKGRHGHVLAIGGDHGYGGAIRLCAEAALRTGAGLVSVATRSAHVGALLASLPEAMCRAIEDPAALELLAARASVLALGPGLGRGDWGRMSFEAALASRLPRVLDADALNLLAEQPRLLPEDVLTPHPGEAARLLGTDVARIEADRLAAAQALAQRYGAVIVLKGAGSVIAAPDRAPALIDAGNPGLAAGGTGDVLTGVIAALRAQGLSAFDAACAGALLHAAAGDLAAIDGERGMLASDLFAPLRRLANPT
jgi:ADP-dependent NAD(P)H-hydrate dehydratase / NAD(P)H-hydrate epimerase